MSERFANHSSMNGSGDDGSPDPLRLIIEFRKKFGMDIPESPRLDGLYIDHADHLEFVEEEVNEARDAIAKLYSGQITEKQAVEGVADAICDAMVFLLHYAADIGISDRLYACFEEVMNSNLSKGQEDGNHFDRNGKLIKGPGYFRPNLTPILFPE